MLKLINLIIFIFLHFVNSDDFWEEFLTKGSYSYGSEKHEPLDLGALSGSGGDNNNPLAFLFGNGR
ncbi:hypothetical protein Mgra_00002728 [Meloidogyne graminicola]|uniref:Uncharacterized protein n=1 Tax=Meloidogyne graminicola TaxID=189291 RepID=A0A8S9ZXT3_9BILA|nr:hypothetical protein Mgra_00002728 [Meloidogyne graminicola]